MCANFLGKAGSGMIWIRKQFATQRASQSSKTVPDVIKTTINHGIFNYQTQLVHSRVEDGDELKDPKGLPPALKGFHLVGVSGRRAVRNLGRNGVPFGWCGWYLSMDDSYVSQKVNENSLRLLISLLSLYNPYKHPLCFFSGTCFTAFIFENDFSPHLQWIQYTQVELSLFLGNYSFTWDVSKHPKRTRLRLPWSSIFWLLWFVGGQNRKQSTGSFNFCRNFAIRKTRKNTEEIICTKALRRFIGPKGMIVLNT